MTYFDTTICYDYSKSKCGGGENLQTKIFYNLTDDILFKNTFYHKKLTIDLLNSFFSYLKQDKKILDVRISKDKSLYGLNRDNKINYGDIIAFLNTNEIVSIEMYTAFDKEEFNKSVTYLSKLYSNQLKRGQKYIQAKKVISINFMSGNYHKENEDLVNDYSFIRRIDCPSNKDECMEMYLVRLDLVKNIVYNKTNERLVRWLKFMNTQSYEEMKQIGKDDEVMEQAIKYIDEFLEKEGTTFQDKIDYEKVKSFDDGLMKGEKAGIMKTAKKMFKDGLNINSIAKYTGLSKEEIENLN